MIFMGVGMYYFKLKVSTPRHDLGVPDFYWYEIDTDGNVRRMIEEFEASHTTCSNIADFPKGSPERVNGSLVETKLTLKEIENQNQKSKSEYTKISGGEFNSKWDLSRAM